MPLVDFDTVSDELDEAQSIRVMTAMVRSSLLHGADNKPSVVILTDKALYWGGCVATGGKFHRVPLNSIVKSGKKGKSLWECVELRHMEIGGEEKVYLCPFTGTPNAPKRDEESMEELSRIGRG
jgi:hypothetical protein